MMLLRTVIAGAIVLALSALPGAQATAQSLAELDPGLGRLLAGYPDFGRLDGLGPETTALNHASRSLLPAAHDYHAAASGRRCSSVEPGGLLLLDFDATGKPLYRAADPGPFDPELRQGLSEERAAGALVEVALYLLIQGLTGR